MDLFPFTKPVPLLRKWTTIGTGDRLGLATPGHLRAVDKFPVRPVLAQQSVRENIQTGRSFPESDPGCSLGGFPGKLSKRIRSGRRPSEDLSGNQVCPRCRRIDGHPRLVREVESKGVRVLEGDRSIVSFTKTVDEEEMKVLSHLFLREGYFISKALRGMSHPIQ